MVIPPSGRLLVILTAEVSGSGDPSGDATSTGFMSFTIDNSVALDTNSLRVTGVDPVRASVTLLVTGLTPGNTVTFRAAYKRVPFGNRGVGGEPARFNARQITVIPG